jgi:hypothetical protein
MLRYSLVGTPVGKNYYVVLRFFIRCMLGTPKEVYYSRSNSKHGGDRNSRVLIDGFRLLLEKRCYVEVVL